jgi:hypothetical protein
VADALNAREDLFNILACDGAMPLFSGDISIDLKKSGSASKDLGVLLNPGRYSVLDFAASKIKFLSRD